MLIAGGHRQMEPREDKTDDWVRRTQAEMATMVWAQPTIKHSFYKNAYGEVYTLSPWRLVDYWTWTREPRSGRLRLRLTGYASSQRMFFANVRASSDSVPHW